MNNNENNIFDNSFVEWLAVPALFLLVAIIFIYGAVYNFLMKPMTFIEGVDTSLKRFNDELIDMLSDKKRDTECQCNKRLNRDDWWHD